MLAISLMAGVIHACVSGLLIMPASQVAMILIAGWVLSFERANQQSKGQRLFRTGFVILRVLDFRYNC